MSEVKSLILRFRDLSIPNTIEAHKKIIEEKEYVWWGWWAKPQEKVALEIFADLKERIKEEGKIDIFLFNSGELNIYKATCIDIEMKNGEEISSPDKEATPEYYSENQYMLWFKFSNIDQKISDADSFLKGYSYVEINEQFVSNSSPFDMFDQKVVYSVEELYQQQRTIWFLRDKKSSDEEREIASYNPPKESYEKDFTLDETGDILWLTDLHFSEGHHAFISTVGSTNKLSSIIEKTVESLDNKKLSRIIVSGDFTYCASEAEFKEAEEFFKDMKSIYSLSPSRFTLCPGNHDFEYSKNPYKDDDKVELIFDEAKKNYINFYESVKGVRANKYINSIQRFISNTGNLFEIITLNTCLLQQDEQHFRGMGFVGNDQMDEITKQLKKTEGVKATRILVLHHNLLPVAYTETPKINPMYSMFLDSEAVSQFCINNNIKIILHGHTHKSFYSQVTRQIKNDEKFTYHIIGLSSSGAKREDLGQDSKNEIAIINISDNKKVEIAIYCLETTGNAQNQNPVKKFEIIL